VPRLRDYANSLGSGTVFRVGIKKENFVIVSGNRRSSRFPYYMNTYGFQRSRASHLAVATGLKAIRPDMEFWVGDRRRRCASLSAAITIHICGGNVRHQVRFSQ